MKAAEIRSSPRPVRALHGIHERVLETVIKHVSSGGRALDLGAGSGALVERLQAAGFRVTAADIGSDFELSSEFLQLDFNSPVFDRELLSEFDLVTSIEVIEHLENPTAFLRCICRLLKPEGIAILTTPNVENVAARLKFLIGGELRAMNKNSPEHVTPIFLDLFVRKIVPASGLQLIEYFVYPKNAFPLTGRRYFVPFFRLLAPFLSGPALTGDSHFLVLKKMSSQPLAVPE